MQTQTRYRRHWFSNFGFNFGSWQIMPQCPSVTWRHVDPLRQRGKGTDPGVPGKVDGLVLLQVGGIAGEKCEVVEGEVQVEEEAGDCSQVGSATEVIVGEGEKSEQWGQGGEIGGAAQVVGEEVKVRQCGGKLCEVHGASECVVAQVQVSYALRQGREVQRPIKSVAE
jgi:hypothetical protein